MNKCHLKALKDAQYSPGWSGGTSPLSWVKSLNYNLELDSYINFPKKVISRQDIFVLTNPM